ncbi:MAG: LpxI family protein, partial [Planctomycetes bacterium]|nr:LpxI family protein [Planctomycetota bacterium]
MTQGGDRSAGSSGPVGLLAGSGRFPIHFAEKARQVGIPVVCVGIRQEAAPELAGLVQRFYWAGVARLGRMIRCFKREGVRQVVMAGKVHKTALYLPWRDLQLLPDWRGLRFLYSRARRDNRDDSMLLAVIHEFAKDGLTFESALDLCPELLVSPGVLTRRAPTAREQIDIALGWELAKE